MSRAGRKIIAGLKEAVRHSRGEETGCKTYWVIRCGCCDKRFSSEDRGAIFCPACNEGAQ
jgi:hypothetical protein